MNQASVSFPLGETQRIHVHQRSVTILDLAVTKGKHDQMTRAMPAQTGIFPLLSSVALLAFRLTSGAQVAAGNKAAGSITFGLLCDVGKVPRDCACPARSVRVRCAARWHKLFRGSLLYCEAHSLGVSSTHGSPTFKPFWYFRMQDSAYPRKG